MVAPNWPYEALNVITYNGVRAYNPGDLVAASAVEGDAAWLVLDEDVKAREGVRLDRPALNASQARWAAYAISQGADPDEVNGMSRAQLIKDYGDGNDESSP